MIARVTCLALLLLAEVVWLSLRIDTASLKHKTTWWAWALGHLPDVASVLLAAAAGGILVAFVQARARRREAPAKGPGWRKIWPFLLVHVGAFCAFAGLAISLFEGDAGASRFADIWVVAWVLLGLLLLASLCLAAFPGTFWISWLRRYWLAGLAAVGIGATALAVGLATDAFWSWLARPTFRLVNALLQAFGQDVVSRPEAFRLGTQSFSVEIAPECSGYQGIGLMWVFLTVYFVLLRRRLRFPHALLLVAVGTVLVWLANGLRLAALVMVGTWISPDIASGGFHSQVGWLFFIAVALGLVVVTQRTRFFLRVEPVAGSATQEADRTAAYLVPLLALVAVEMVTAAFTSGFDWYYPVRVLVTGGALWFIWRRSFTWAGVREGLSWGAPAIGTLAFAAWMALEWLTTGVRSEPAAATALAGMSGGWAAAWLTFRAIGSVITVPLAEELAFRGYLIRRLTSREFDAVCFRRFTWLSFLVSSVLFGALHGQWIGGTLAGMAYAWALHRRGRLADAVVAHATTNAWITAYVLATGNWSLW